MNSVEELASKHLGKRSEGSKVYDKTLLAPVPRNLSIEHIGVSMETLEGNGFDVWYCYEFNCLLNSGLPVAAVLKFVFDHNTKNLIESKSLKLYCNSFYMMKMGANKEEALNKVISTMKTDLEEAAEGTVAISVVTAASKQSIFENYVDLNNFITSDLIVDKYKEAPEVLKIENREVEAEYKFKFDALKSACRITHQPDTGSAYIYYRSKLHIDEQSLMKYLASFRDEYHFHEEILISLFEHLRRILNPEDELMCCALYQRRGSLDIGPIQYKNITNKEVLEDIDKHHKNNVLAIDTNNIMR